MAQSVLSVNTERASRKMLFLLEKYRERFPEAELPIDPRRVAIWAYDEGLWVPKETAPQEILRRKLCRALRHQYTLDPQGREVRANFAAVEEVETPDGPRSVARAFIRFSRPRLMLRGRHLP